jgi:secondary thiamine-phosphate synthase enzyme
MRQSFHELVIATRGRGLIEFTAAIGKWVAENKFRDGLLTLHLKHTSASLLIQENADPDVRAISTRFSRDSSAMAIRSSSTPLKAMTTWLRTSAPR